MTEHESNVSRTPAEVTERLTQSLESALRGDLHPRPERTRLTRPLGEIALDESQE